MELPIHSSAGFSCAGRLPGAFPAFGLEGSNEFFALELSRQGDRVVLLEDASHAELLGRELPVLELSRSGVVRFDSTGKGFAFHC